MKDRSSRLFGRQQDLEALTLRAGAPGLTAVVGRPQIGKTRLLAELARRLDETEPRHLIGHTESREGEPDLLLRAIVDLYARWLEQSGYGQQAAMVWEQQKGDLLKAISSAVKALGSTVTDVALKPFVAVANTALDGLQNANDRLKTGLQLPALQYDQALGLLQALHGVSGLCLVLILDQWEKSRQIDHAATLLNSFVRYLDDWPPCHIVLGLRSDSDREEERAALVEAEALHNVRPAKAALYPLGEMQHDPHEAHRVATWVRSNVPAAADQGDDTLLHEVSGFPGVLMRWHEQRDEIADADGLHRIARDAHAYRYPELKAAFDTLKGDARRLAIRLVLLPQGAGEFWPSIKAEVLGELDETLLDDLCAAGVLESQEPPTFGHPKRLEVARAHVFESQNFRSTCRREAVHLILAMGACIKTPDSLVVPFVAVLAEQARFGKQVGIPFVPQVACFAALASFGVPVPDSILKKGAQAFAKSPVPELAAVFALGLSRTMLEACKRGESSRRDLLLEQVSALIAACPGNSVVRDRLSYCLMTARADAKECGQLTRRDAIFQSLLSLQETYPHDNMVGEALAFALIDTIHDARGEVNPQSYGSLVKIVCDKTRSSLTSKGMIQTLALGMWMEFHSNASENNRGMRDHFLSNLHELSNRFKHCTGVAEYYAKCLLDAILYAGIEGYPKRQNDFVRELHGMIDRFKSQKWPRLVFASGIVNALSPENKIVCLATEESLLSELRSLANAHHDDDELWLRLGQGLVYMVLQARITGHFARAHQFQRELLSLAQARPEDLAMQEIAASV